MIPSIDQIVSQFKKNWTKCLAPEAIDALCKEQDLSFRRRLLTPAVTVQLMLLQVLHGYTAISHLPHLAQMKFWPSSFSRARMRVPLSFFEALLQRIIDNLQEEDYNEHTWLGQRVFVADGTGISMPDTPELVEEFGYPSNVRKGAGFPVARLVFMLHLGTGMVAKLLVNPYRTHEARFIPDLHLEIKEGDVFLGDRAFCSYTHFCLLLERKAHGLMRMNEKMLSYFPKTKKTASGKRVKPAYHQIPDNRKQLRLIGKNDHIVRWNRPSSKPPYLTKEQYKKLPKTIVIRELLYKVKRKGFRASEIVVLTTLLDEKKYPAPKIAELYRIRWEIETNFNHLKTSMRMDILKETTPEGIKKQLIIFSILYNLVRLVMIQAAKKQKMPVNRISFLDALRWLAAASSETQLYSLLVVPDRPNRFEPRSRKRRPKAGYPYVMLPRPELRKKKLSQCINY